MKRLYEMGALKRTVIIWTAFMALLWAVFGIAALVYPDAYQLSEDAVPAGQMNALSLFTYIVVMNALVGLLIAGGNLFVRFGVVTPGLLVLAYQGIQIGWLAGTNGFATPFSSVWAAHMAFLRVGLWETSAYALVCAVTLPKSLYIAATFPARAWEEERTLHDVRLDKNELAILAVAIIFWLGAAVSETLLLT
ncbi:MAG TPA: hypothetical protein GXZ82_15470 [Firmicutes bacterium]|nr:hypothetical protein [Bacillota bacterium]